MLSLDKKDDYEHEEILSSYYRQSCKDVYNTNRIVECDLHLTPSKIDKNIG